MDHYGDLAQMAQHFSVSRLSEHSDLLQLFGIFIHSSCTIARHQALYAYSVRW